jgi:hypothetical protein
LCIATAELLLLLQPLPPNKMALARIEKEKAELAKKEAKKVAQLSATIEKEGKRGWFW